MFSRFAYHAHLFFVVHEKHPPIRPTNMYIYERYVFHSRIRKWFWLPTISPYQIFRFLFLSLTQTQTLFRWRFMTYTQYHIVQSRCYTYFDNILWFSFAVYVNFWWLTLLRMKRILIWSEFRRNQITTKEIDIFLLISI